MKTTTINEATRIACIRALQDADYVRDHVYIGLQRSSAAPMLKRAGMLPGTEEYLFVRGETEDMPWRVRLQEELLEDLYLTVEEVWACAYANTIAPGTTVIEPLAELLEALAGPLYAETVPGAPMYVVSNRKRFFGAAQILDRMTIREYFSKEWPDCKRLIVIPSSIHECILIPIDDEEIDLEDFHRMVHEVNASTVDEEEQLGDCCYVMELNDG